MEALGALAILFGFGLALAVMGLVVWAIVDASRYTSQEWRQAGQSKTVWLAIVIGVAVVGCFAFGWIGALLYVLIPRPALKRTRAASVRWA